MPATTNQLSIDQLHKEGGDAAKEALDELARLAKVTEDWPGICERAAINLVPFVRTQLDESWNRTKLKAFSERKTWKNGDYSGALYQAWVTKSIIKANQLGILVYIAPNMSDSVYKRAGEFQHGGVHGAQGLATSKKLRTFKQQLKRKAKGKSKNLGGGVRTVEARPMYFDNAQAMYLAMKYVGLVNGEINRLYQVS